ncbi:TetR/AcrR family transcriptional regulator [Agilicoccus flavus]|uniref:TetR/AcrR family transcriptional regulator n=1 Tax=Agilicoccus flavus TaxID=2775968 RepID=UPI001CF6E157|nr:TetR/AcrR family transcriptional regulator [Agilicoccus flavus]
MVADVPAPRTTADARRATVLSCAIVVFARAGYYATPVADVAAAAKISPAYVFRLFPSKLALFVAALNACFARVVAALEAGADDAACDDPEKRLAEMGDAYARLIGDRTLLMLQVHALSASDVPEVRHALRRGLEQVVTVARTRTGASPAAVQQFVAYGQLCHLLVATELVGTTPAWATALTAGMAHPDPPATEEDAD